MGAKLTQSIGHASGWDDDRKRHNEERLAAFNKIHTAPVKPPVPIVPIVDRPCDGRHGIHCPDCVAAIRDRVAAIADGLAAALTAEVK